MAVKAASTITVTNERNIVSVTRYYVLSPSLTTPDKPTVYPPPTLESPAVGWMTTEPDYTSGSTSYLYFTDVTIFTNNEFLYSDVSKSSSYEAAKEAYNKAAEISDKTRSGFIETLSGTGFVQSNKTEDGGTAEVVVYGKSVQDGTPTPEAPVEIQSVENPNVTVCATVTEYEPYQGNTATLSDIVLRSTPDGTRDRVFKDTDGLWKIERNVGKVTFDGSESGWSKNAYVANYSLNRSGTGIKPSTDVFCDRFVNGLLSDGAGIVYNGSDTIIFRMSSISTLEAWKTWLSNNNVTLCYIKDTPTYETLPDQIQAELNALTTYNPITNVMVSDGVTPDIDVSFWTRDHAAKEEAAAAAKVATNYIEGSEDGLIVGNMTAETLGRHVLIDVYSVDVRNADAVLASFGETTTVGETSGQHVSIDSDSLDIKNGDAVLATFSGDTLKCGENFSVDKTGKITSTSGTIGGFTITSNSIYNGTSSLSSDVDGVYLGTDGIRTVAGSGSAVHSRHYSKYMYTDDYDDFLTIAANGIGFYHYSTDEGTELLQRLAFYENDSFRYSLNDIGIYGSTGNVMVGLDNSTVDAYVNLRFPLETQVGTDDAPSGRHVLANNTSVSFLNTSGTRIRGIGLGSTDNILIGADTGTAGMYGYVTAQNNIVFYAGTSHDQCFASIYDNGKRYFQSQPIYDRTTSSGTAVRVNSNGTLYRYSSSSMRYKEEITCQLSEELNPERLYDLNVWQYKYREGHLDKGDQRYGKTHIGLLAEDVKQHYPIAANYNEDGYVEDWSERYLIPPMLKLIQMQHEEIELIKDELKRIRDAEEKGENL